MSFLNSCFLICKDDACRLGVESSREIHTAFENISDNEKGLHIYYIDILV